ncbi:MAG: hypothetical protein AAGU21_01165 [Solidesulfovibrio sp.]|uniref:hypothetical protein n=1 Tax=Solidesulfovibrio sp. TaxID=2910990 RepID=UPI002B2066CC|nr:hypothetical protein [Solidesulfovibrio sp.]MEA4857089.1 hypothetical protein [Solidesulfovibrio sp.]
MTIQLTKENCPEIFEEIVKETRKRLPNGYNRFPDTNGKTPLALCCLAFYPEHYDFEAPCSPTDFEIKLASEFWEDINTIITVTNDFEIEFDICKWLKDEKSKKHCNEQGIAIQIWEQFANPFRHHDAKIYVIHPPSDYLFGVPSIHEFKIEDFLAITATAFKKYSCEVLKVTKQKDRFDKLFAVSAIINIFAISAAILSFMER